MPAAKIPTPEDVDKLFEDRLSILKGVVRRQTRTQPDQKRAEAIVESIATFIRSRWDNATSLHSWYKWGGSGESDVTLNILYEALSHLGVDLHEVLKMLFKDFGWLERAIAIVDDTGFRKYGRRMPAISKVHVANTKGGVAGHNFVTLMLQDDKGSAFYDAAQKVNNVVPKSNRRKGRKTDAVRRMQEATKHQLARDMIAKALQDGVSLTHVLFDAWYLCAETANWLENVKHLKFVSRAKSNTSFIVDGQEVRADAFIAAQKSWRRVRKTDHFCYQKEAVMKNGVKVKLVAVWFFRGRSLKKTATVLVTNDLALSAAAVVLLYLSRWSTEQGYKMLKHNLAWANYRSTSLDSNSSAQRLGLIAYALASSVQQSVTGTVGLPTLLEMRKLARRTMAATGTTGHETEKPKMPTEKLAA